MICLELSGTRWNFAASLDPVVDPVLAAQVRRYQLRVSQWLFYGTKLEQWQKECYMWITGDRQARGSGKRIGSVQGGPGKSQGSLKTIPALMPTAERPARPVILPVNFESGERRWREA